MKRVIAILLLAFLPLAFIQCGKNDGSASGNSHQSSESVMTDSLSSDRTTGGTSGTSLETSTPTNDSGTATNPAATELGDDSGR